VPTDGTGPRGGFVKCAIEGIEIEINGKCSKGLDAILDVVWNPTHHVVSVIVSELTDPKFNIFVCS
jgi:hypothetical protein